jgi:type II secretory pathway predicted ATPase ExeA
MRRKKPEEAAQEAPTSVYSDFERAEAKLKAALASGPFYGLLTGPSGSGKTSLLRQVARTLDPHRFQVHYLAHSQASGAGVARFVAAAVHLASRRTHSETLRAMGECLRSLAFRVVLFVDEANLLSEEALGEVRLLSESELDSAPLLSVVFSGLPELKTKLETPALFPLRRRISLRLELTGLREEEVGPFLALRLGEPEAARLSGEVRRALFERTAGIPALLENLARECLQVPQKGTLGLESVSEIFDAWDIT